MALGGSHVSHKSETCSNVFLAELFSRGTSEEEVEGALLLLRVSEEPSPPLLLSRLSGVTSRTSESETETTVIKDMTES